MKKFLVAAFAAASLSACGLANDIAAALNTKGSLDAAKVSATGYTLAKNVQDIKALSGGLDGLIPKMGGAGGGASFAPAMRLAPGLAPTTFACQGLSSYPQVVTGSQTKENFAAEAEETKTIETGEFLCPSAGANALVLSFHVEAWYKDDSTGTADAVELDAADLTTGNDLSAGLTSVVVHRYFAESDERLQFTLEAEVDFDGTFEAPNYWHHGKFTIAMRNGTTVVAEVTPETPLADGEEFTKGTASRTTTFAEGAITSVVEEATVTGKDLGTYHVVTTYADGTKDDVTVSADGTQLSIDAKGHNGFTRVGTLQLASGEFSLVTTFPAGSPIVKVTEDGVWHKNATQGTYNRKTEWADGRVSESKVTANVNGNSISATFTHDDNTADAEDSLVSGKIDILENPVLTTVKVEISNAAGDKATLDGVKYADGSAKLHFTLDLVATDVNPDQEGDIAFAADGTGTGTVTVHENGVEKTLTFTVKADGSAE